MSDLEIKAARRSLELADLQEAIWRADVDRRIAKQDQRIEALERRLADAVGDFDPCRIRQGGYDLGGTGVRDDQRPHA